MKTYAYKTGDRVAYNHSYLKSTHADKDIADMRGTVISTKELRKGLSLVKILWDGEIIDRTSISSNVCRVTNIILDPTE